MAVRGSGDGRRAAAAAQLRLGHIPAGSTDAVAYSLNGTRSAATAALHVALGDRYGFLPFTLTCRQAERPCMSCMWRASDYWFALAAN